MELSIIIPSYNTKSHLKKCLISIYKYLKDFSYEVIVVDNASSDGTSLMVKKLFPQVKLISLRRNCYFCQSSNIGAQLSVGKFLLFFNSDAFFHNSTFPLLFNYLNLHSQIGAISGIVLFPGGKVQSTYWNFRTPFEEIKKREPFFRLTKKISPPITNTPLSVDVIPGTFLLIRREVFFKVGMFNEKLRLSFCEDDLCKRIKQKSWKVFHYPYTSIIHTLFGSQPNKGKDIKLIVIKMIDTLRYFEKYYNLGIILLLLWGLFFSLVIEGIKIGVLVLKWWKRGV
jgi:hypothetical protein